MNGSNIRKKLVAASAVLCVAGVLQGCSDDGGTAVDLFTFLAKGGLGGADGTGGKSFAGTGGNGGSLTISNFGTGDVLTTNAGEAAATFSPRDIAGITKNLGSNPLMITSDTTIPAIDMGMPRPTTAGMPYMITGGSFPFMYMSPGSGDVDGTQDRVTGLAVGEAGSTATAIKLILGLNSVSGVNLQFANDVCNFGEITTENDGFLLRGVLIMISGRYIGTGDVNTFGIDDGQSGGAIGVMGNFAVYNSGAFNAYGANATGAATDGGDGGNISLFGGFDTQNTGLLSSYGGSAADGAGGDGAVVQINSDGDALNSGTIDAHGGDGTTGGGEGAQAAIFSSEFGAVKNTGAFMAYGGNATTDTAGSGGMGGEVFIVAGTGGVWQNADIMTYGGNTEGTTAGGGNGGNINILGLEINFAGANDNRAAGDISVSGNINTNGGNALATGTGNGGLAGSVNAQFLLDGGLGQNGDKPQDRRMITFRGYNLFNFCGGDGNYGGSGGFFDSFIDSEEAFNSVRYAGGNVTNNIPVDAIGGNVAAGATTLPYLAGNGGSFNLSTALDMGFVVENMAALNTAAVNLSAGTGAMDVINIFNRANGGVFDMFGYNSAQNTGAVTSNGTADASSDGLTTGIGGNGGSMNIASEMGVATNAGEVTINGGNGEFEGGDAGFVSIVGFSGASNGANITGLGGNADPALADSKGGNGANVRLFTGTNGNASSSGTITNDRGVGETNGIGGSLGTNDSCTGDGCSLDLPLPPLVI